MKSIKHALFGLFGIVGLSISMFGLFKVPFAESAAKEYWRQALVAIFLILALIAGIFGLFIYTFDANNFKSQIIDYVKVHKQRDLALDGDIKVTFFPKLGLNTGRVTLTERNSRDRFASIENARLYVAWLPLLRKQLEIDRITLEGVQARVVRYKNGSSNLDDLLLHDDSLDNIRFDIDGVSLANSSAEFQDEIEKVHFFLRGLSIETGRLTDSMPSNLTASFRLESELPLIRANTKLTSHLFFDRKAGHYEFSNFEGNMEGDAAGISSLVLKFDGSLSGSPAQGTLKLDKLSASATGQLNGHTLDAKMELPQLQISRENISGSKLSIVSTLSHGDENIDGSLQLATFTLSNSQFNAPECSAEINLKQPDRTLQAKLSSPISASLDNGQWELSKLTARYSVSHPNLSAPLDGKISGNINLNWLEEELKSTLEGSAGETDMRFSLSMKNFQHPAYIVDANIKQLNLDRLLVTDWNKHLLEDNAALDFSLLKSLRLRGAFRVDELQLANLKLHQLTFDAQAEQATLQLDSINADLYGGNLSGSLSVRAQTDVQLNLKQKLDNIQLDTLLNDLYGNSRITGKSTLSISASSAGNTPATLRQALAGNIEFASTRGTLRGFNLAESLGKGKSLVGVPEGLSTVSSAADVATDFTELKSAIVISQGQATISETVMKSPLLVSKASGNINLADCNLNLQLETAINASLKRATQGDLAEMKGMTVPSRLSGNCHAPSLALDFSQASGGNFTRLSKANLTRVATPDLNAGNKPPVSQ